jgi:hypothetical protein
MKKIIKMFMVAMLIVATCVSFASCKEEEPPACVEHADADANLVCDVCGATLTPAGPSQEEIDSAAKTAIVNELNTFFASGVSLVNGDRKLPSLSGPVVVETCTFPETHWIARLKTFNIVDGRIKMTLVNDAPGATEKLKDVYVGFTPTGMYSIEDNTMELDYETHLYTGEQLSVWVEELALKDIYGSNGVYSFKHDTLESIFSSILLAQTTQQVLGDLYDVTLINRLVEIMQSTSEIKVNEYNQISSINVRLYTEDNGLKTDICTLIYTYEPARQYFKLSLNLNYIMDVEYENVATSTFQVFNKTFKYHTEKPGDVTFVGDDLVLRSNYSMADDAIITFENDIMDAIQAVEDKLIYARIIKEKYSETFTIVGSPWVCDKVYVYDTRYNLYVLLAPESEESGGYVTFESIEFDYELDLCCLGTIDLISKRIEIVEHSAEELLRAEMKAKYDGKFICATHECLSVGFYDTESRRYILFDRRYNDEDGYYYVYNSMSTTMDKSTTCVAEVDIESHQLSMLEHNTNHTTH